MIDPKETRRGPSWSNAEEILHLTLWPNGSMIAAGPYTKDTEFEPVSRPGCELRAISVSQIWEVAEPE
jgi:hypothetical protein